MTEESKELTQSAETDLPQINPANPDEILDRVVKDLREMSSSPNMIVGNALFNQISRLQLHQPSWGDKIHTIEQTAFAIETIRAMKAENPLEQIQIAQMVMCHNAMIRCMNIGYNDSLSPEIHQFYIRMADKLMKTYSQQLATFNKGRNGGKQQVVVKHVNVQEGGQAIVGSVNTGGRVKK